MFPATPLIQRQATCLLFPVLWYKLRILVKPVAKHCLRGNIKKSFQISKTMKAWEFQGSNITSRSKVLMFVPEIQVLVTLEKYNGYNKTYGKWIGSSYFQIIFFFKAQVFENKARLHHKNDCMHSLKMYSELSMCTTYEKKRHKILNKQEGWNFSLSAFFGHPFKMSPFSNMEGLAFTQFPFNVWQRPFYRKAGYHIAIYLSFKSTIPKTLN